MKAPLTILTILTILSMIFLIGCSSSDDDGDASSTTTDPATTEAAAAPIDVSGNWNITIGDSTGSVTLPLSLQQDGTSLSGSAGAGSVMGDIDGDQISLAVSNSGASFVLNGTASTDRMSGQAVVDGETGSFTAVR